MGDNMKEKLLKKLKYKTSVTFLSVKFVFAKNKIYLILVIISELLNALKILPYIYLLKTAVTMLMETSKFTTYILSIS